MTQFYSPLVAAQMQATILMLIPVPCLSSNSMAAKLETWQNSITAERQLDVIYAIFMTKSK